MTAYRVGLLAPMQLELAPMVRDLGLFETVSGTWRGCTPAGVEIVAVCTNIGMEAARNATNTILELDVDYVIVAGIAGATSTATNIGSLGSLETGARRSTASRPSSADEDVRGAAATAPGSAPNRSSRPSRGGVMVGEVTG